MNLIYIVRHDGWPEDVGIEPKGLFSDEAKARECWEKETPSSGLRTTVDLETWEFEDGVGRCVRNLSRTGFGEVRQYVYDKTTQQMKEVPFEQG